MHYIVPMENKTTRCPWVNLNNPLYIAYHDREWGKPLHDDRGHFELLTLEGAQAGLSWEIVLNKRENYRQLFCNFDPKLVAKFNDKKIAALLNNPGIIRNRLKIASTVINAQAFCKIQREFSSFDNYIWSFINHTPIINKFTALADYPSSTPLSDKISKDLKKRGFKFVGSTIIYAYMQAAGLVNDHVLDCCKRWKVYMVRGKDGSLYTGITTDITRRLQQHNNQDGAGAKYLRGKVPCVLVYQEDAGDKSSASKREAEIKKMSKTTKELLCHLTRV